MKELHPLEALALSSLPSAKARIGRLAWLVRQGKLGYFSNWTDLRVRDAKEIIKSIREPWGKRGKMVSMLIAEHSRQTRLRRKRENYQTYWPPKHDDYDVVTARFCRERNDAEDLSLEERRNSIALRRLYTLTANNPSALLPQGHSIGNLSSSAWQLGETKIRRETMLLVDPDVHNAQGAWLSDHNVHYLYLIRGKVVSVVRVGSGSNIRAAINSLKTSIVRKAETSGSTITIDWDDEVFLVKNPKRKKPRRIAFKRYARRRNGR